MSSADARALFTLFATAAAASYFGPSLVARVQRALSSKKGLSQAGLLEELESARERVAALLPIARDLVTRSEADRASQRRRGRDAGPLPLSQLCGTLEGALRAADVRHFERDGAGASEADVAHALVVHARAPAVAAAVTRVLEAHPLHAPPALVLKVQEKVVELEVREHAAAVDTASSAGVALDSAGFKAILSERLSACLTAAGCAFGAASGSLAPVVLAGEPLFSHRVPLWAHIVGFSLTEATAPAGSASAAGAAPRASYVGFADSWTRLMAEQKARLRALGLVVQ